MLFRIQKVHVGLSLNSSLFADSLMSGGVHLPTLPSRAGPGQTNGYGFVIFQ